MKKAFTLTAVVTLVFAVFALAACSKSTYSQEVLENDTGGMYLKITAENASESSATTSEALSVEDGDVIVISPDLTKGAIHVTITSTDGKEIAYDDDADGRVLFTVEAQPGTYDAKTTGVNGATGSMTIFTMSAAEFGEQNAALEEILEKNGIDSSAAQTKTK